MVKYGTDVNNDIILNPATNNIVFFIAINHQSIMVIAHKIWESVTNIY